MSNPARLRRPAEVLLVDDDENDAFLVQLAFQRTQCGVKVNVHVVNNGLECLAFLRREQAHSEAPIPDLILLDLNMPMMGGLDTLRALTEDARLCVIPTIVLTTSSSERDVQEAYALGCRTYLVKPLEFDEFQSTIDQICSYWFGLALLPGRSE